MNQHITASEEQLRRVAHMEDIFDHVSAALDSLGLAVREYSALRPELLQLENYYENGQWMSDFLAEREDAFPKDMKRGILTEDAIYDLLTEVERVKQGLNDLCRLK